MSDLTSRIDVEALRPGARNAVLTCMAVTGADRVLIIGDEATGEIVDVLAEESQATGADVQVALLEAYGERPVLEVPARLLDGALAFAPTVSFFAAASRRGEITFRLGLREMLLDRLKVRHGHMPGITPQLMVEGMRADYQAVAGLTQRVYTLARQARAIEVTTPDGTAVRAEFDPGLRWIPCTGLYHTPGAWGNLPEGETFTCPANLNGIIVAHLLGDYFSAQYGVLREPVRIEVRDGWVTSVTGGSDGVAGELERYLDSAENGRRAGEFAIGTNVALTRLSGNLLQDEKLPGVHIAFGNPYPSETGAGWRSNVHVDVIPVHCDIAIDGRALMGGGVFDYDALGAAQTAGGEGI